MTDTTSTSTPYSIHTSGVPPTAIDAWSSTRLSFEPHAWQLNLRRELRAAISALTPSPSTCLHAMYTAPASDLLIDNDGSDVENILFYNLGPAAFARAMTYGVRFERASRHIQVRPASILKDRGQAQHHYHYALAPLDACWQAWQPDVVLATWEIPLAPEPRALAALRSCATVWRTMHGHIVSMAPQHAHTGHFGVLIGLEVPAGARLHLHTLLKPLLDGVISALHCADQPPSPEVCHRLAANLSMDAADIKTWLTAGESVVLGPRALVRPFGAGVKWNPADDRCDAVDIRIARTTGLFALRGKVMTLKPCAPDGAEA